LRKRWAHLIRCVYLTDPLICPDCGGKLRVIAFITELGKNLEGDLAIELRVEGEDPAHHEALSSLQARRIVPGRKVKA
jgi:hypothetical protein